MTAMTGRCLCGAVTVTVDGGHDGRVGICHCGICRRWTGGVYADMAVAASSVAVEGAVTRYASSDFAERAFCGVCGTHLWFRGTAGGDGHYSLMPGLFTEAAGFPLSEEIYADCAPVWAAIAGDHPRVSGADYERDNRSVQGESA